MHILSRAEIEAEIGPCDEVTPIGSPGGSGECWKVVQGSDERALKAIVKNPDPERFDREVAAMTRVSSPHVVRIDTHGTIPTKSGITYPYILGEFINGADTRTKLSTEGVPSNDELRAFVDRALQGIKALHGAGIIHRDLKPENIMLRGSQWSRPVIIDLGLSRLLDLTTLTVYPWAGGTWPYMAPEQLFGDRALDRTDLWGLAVTIAEVAEGHHPFWQGEPNPPADWDTRLQLGITASTKRGRGYREWITSAGRYPAYRRPSAEDAHVLLETVWPG